jgi:hypothetical protein
LLSGSVVRAPNQFRVTLEYGTLREDRPHFIAIAASIVILLAPICSLVGF